MKSIFLLNLFISLYSISYSQEIPDTAATTSELNASNGEWINKELDACFQVKDISTPEQAQCLYDAIDNWEAQLNATYILIISQVDEPAKTSLKSSQVAWTNYKNVYFKFLEQYYGAMQGVMYKQLMLSEKISVLKERNTSVFNLLQD